VSFFTDSIRNLAAGMIVAALIVYALVAGQDVFVPLALATLLAFILSPLVRFLKRYHVPHALAVTGTMIIFTATLLGGMVAFTQQLASLTANISVYQENLLKKVRSASDSQLGDGALRRAGDALARLEQEVGQSGQSQSGSDRPVQVEIQQSSRSYISSIFNMIKPILLPISTAGLMILFAAFLLLQLDDIRDRIVRLVGTDYISETTAAIDDAGERLSHLFLMQALLNLGFGTFVTVALWFIGIPNPLLWGAATAILRFVPLIGSVISAVPPIALAAAVDPGWSLVIATAAIFALGEPLMGQVVEPLVLGRHTGLSPMAIIVAASFWTLIWGPVGLLVAIPLTLSVVALGQYVPRLEFLGILLGDAPALSPSQQFYRRILAGEADAASKQYIEAVAKGGEGAAGDTIVLNSLRLGAGDASRNRFGPEQIEIAGETFDQFLDMVSAEESAEGTQATDTERRVLVVAARGQFDVKSAEYVASFLQRRIKLACASIAESAGLLALSSAAEDTANRSARAVIISTVGGATRSQLHLLARRARREFPSACIFIADWGVQRLASEQTDKVAGVDGMLTRLNDATERLTPIARSDASSNEVRNAGSQCGVTARVDLEAAAIAST